MIPKPLLTAATDPRLRPPDLAAYVLLLAHLDYLTYRRLKLRWLAKALQMDPGNLSRTLHRLIDRGYLELSPDDGEASAKRLSARYRIPFSPAQ